MLKNGAGNIPALFFERLRYNIANNAPLCYNKSKRLRKIFRRISAMDIIKEKLRLLPDNPGVYIMLDKYKNVIYVGKARVLKNRVRQYFHSSPKPDKVMRMVENIADFNYIITKTERDALALENNHIKKYKP